MQDQLLARQVRPPYVPPAVNLSKETSTAISKRAFMACIEVFPIQREEIDEDDGEKPKKRSAQGWDQDF